MTIQHSISVLLNSDSHNDQLKDEFRQVAIESLSSKGCDPQTISEPIEWWREEGPEVWPGGYSDRFTFTCRKIPGYYATGIQLVESKD